MMVVKQLVTRTFLVSLLLVLLCRAAPAQRKLGLEADNWAIELSKGGLTEVNSMGSLYNLLLAADSMRALRFMDTVERSPSAKGYFFTTHFNMVKADFLDAKFAGNEKFTNPHSQKIQQIKQQLMQLYTQAVNAAYHTEDNLTIGWVGFYSSRVLRHYGEIGWAMMYSKNGVDLFELQGYNVEPTVYTALADLLYQMREYDESLAYAQKGIAAWKKVDEREYFEPYKTKIKGLNLAGLGFYHRQQYDSAMRYYQAALDTAQRRNDTLLIGTTLGNIGRILFQQQQYDSAHRLFTTDYQNNLQRQNYHLAANAIQWAARADFATGNKAKALAELREALQLLRLRPNEPFRRDCYQTLMQTFRSMNQLDSALYYSEQYASLNDSLEREIASSSLAISKARINNEQSRFNIEKLSRQKKAELLWRNMIIVSIIIVAIIALLVINRQLLKEKLKAQNAEQEKLRIEQEKIIMEQEMNAAREQLSMITANIVEKTNLIEKLEQQIKGKEATVEQQEVIRELSEQTILTEEDWKKFKSVFEKVYPGFFVNLMQQFPDITAAEQRMAALIRLHLNSKQTASMLGISVDSVHKSKQRLRLRFQLDNSGNLDELVGRL